MITTTKKTTTRVQLELAASSMTRLSELKDKTEATSYAEVVKNSLRLYEDIIKKQDEGYTFLLKKDGKEVEYRIF